MSYDQLEMDIVRWGEARGIVQNSTPFAQCKKTLEEVIELQNAIRDNNREEMMDAYGDILVTLIMGCACADLNLMTCLAHAYEQIKDRKGYLGADGIFVKEA